MKKNPLFWAVILSAACLLLSVGASLLFNEGRLVYPTVLSAYQFRLADLPMLLSVTATVLSVTAFLLQALLTSRRRQRDSRRTRKLNPRLGLLGFLGLSGFLGFWTYRLDGTVTPCCFFVFFGFFGFFFEGKLSNTLMDERYQENVRRAQLDAYKAGFVLLWVVLLAVGHGPLWGSLELTAVALTSAVSLALGLTLFLSEYLLYRYDHDGEPEG